MSIDSAVQKLAELSEKIWENVECSFRNLAQQMIETWSAPNCHRISNFLKKVYLKNGDDEYKVECFERDMELSALLSDEHFVNTISVTRKDNNNV